MGPVLHLDKSTIQGLNPTEVDYLYDYYTPLITPILMRELVSTLAKNEKQEDLENKLQKLASKLNGCDAFHCADATGIAISSLAHDDIPLTGQVPKNGGKRVRSVDGSYGVMFEEAIERKILRSWENGIFTLDGKTKAQMIREEDHGLDLVELQSEIKKNMSNLPTFKDLKSLSEWLDSFYFQRMPQQMLLKHAIDVIRPPAEAIELILKRWKDNKEKNFKKFSRYGSYYLKVVLYFQFGLGQGLIKAKKSEKNHLDTQYLLYLPFSFCFSSADNYLINSAPYFLRRNQYLITKDELKKDFKAYDQYWKSIPEDKRIEEKIKNKRYPPKEVTNTKTQIIWEGTMSPRPSKDEPEVKLSKEESDKILKNIKMMTEKSVDAESNRSINKLVAEKYSSYDLDARTNLILKEMIRIFSLDSEDALENVKKNMSRDQVSEFYQFYGDVWRPDTDYHKFLPKPIDRARAIYQGDICPEMFLSFIISNVFLFDEILIVDPIWNPWSMKHEHNPVNKPESYMEDTLKVIIFYLMAMPYIEAGIIKIIQDPFSNDYGQKKEIYSYLEKNHRNLGFSKRGNEEIEQLKKKHILRTAQRIAQYTDPNRLKSFLNLDGEEFERIRKFILHQGKKDLLTLEQPISDTEGSMTLGRNGLDFESTLYIARLTGSLPATNFWENRRKYNIFAKGKKNSFGIINKGLKKLKIPVFHGANPYKVCGLHKDGFLDPLRRFIFFCQVAHVDNDIKMLQFLEEKLSAVEKIAQEDIDFVLSANKEDGKDHFIELAEFELFTASLGIGSKFVDKLLKKRHKQNSFPPRIHLAIYTPTNFEAIVTQFIEG